MIIEKLPNGVTFKIRNDTNGIMKNIHHDRLIQRKQNDKDDYDNQKTTLNNKNDVIDLSDPKSESDNSTCMDKKEHEIEHRYPRRVHQQRNLEGTIPWDAIDIWSSLYI